jgi:peroxiredoxin
LLGASLLVAVVVIAIFAWTQRPDDSADDSSDDTADDTSDVDAVLNDPGAVITFPDDGLGNQDVSGDPLPDAVLVATDGTEVNLADMTGEPLVINFWYTTCPPCAKELPEFATVDAETDDVRFIGVNPRDSLEAMQQFAGERGVEYDLYRDGQAEAIDGIGAAAFPITLFVTSDGTIVEQTGALDADELRTKIGNLLAIDQAA